MMIALLVLLLLVVSLLIAILIRISGINLSKFEYNFTTLNQNQEKTERSTREEMARNREEIASQIFKLTQTIEQKLKNIQNDNSQKLEQMRATVEEKLQSTLEKRLGESFKIVSERLEQVHKGLGEMQTLAIGVGDLKKILSNVKQRGIMGEIQLGSLLEDMLAKEQYGENIATRKDSSETVEYAVKLPGHSKEEGVVWLPIDAKFPLEDYQKLVEAYEQANPALVEKTTKKLESVIKNEAKRIREKYIDPPHTTDFGIMFLPFEGLYAEVLRIPGILEILRRQYNIVITGPTTLTAFLGSLQMGFRTLAIEKRTSEVWKLLGAVKTEFGRFGDLLDKTHKKLQEASSVIEDASRKTRSIERKLGGVEQLPLPDTTKMLGETEESELVIEPEPSET